MPETPMPREGCDRCYCGAKYWDGNICASCGERYDPVLVGVAAPRGVTRIVVPGSGVDTVASALRQLASRTDIDGDLYASEHGTHWFRFADASDAQVFVDDVIETWAGLFTITEETAR